MRFIKQNFSQEVKQTDANKDSNNRLKNWWQEAELNR
jgi:hypothetical protein